MSLPFIIWTMRRTGGTTLTDLLMTFSDRPRLEHEPFNYNRELGVISRAFRDTKDAAALRAALIEALGAGPSIKHCYELGSNDFNRILAEITTQLGYRHIVLTRQDETGRLLSLEIAQLTGAWGKHDAQSRYKALRDGTATLPPINLDHVLGHQRACRNMTQAVETVFDQLGIAPLRIAFEEVYTDPEAGRARVRALCDALEIRPVDPAAFERELDIALREKGQNTAAVYDAVPNLDEARVALDAAAAAAAAEA